jgi:hypothetical protein
VAHLVEDVLKGVEVVLFAEIPAATRLETSAQNHP